MMLSFVSLAGLWSRIEYKLDETPHIGGETSELNSSQQGLEASDK